MPKVYFGWYIVAVALITNALLVGIAFSSYGIFVLPVSQDLGLSRADMNSGLVLMNIGAAITAPFLGRLLDRLRLKPVILVSVLVYGASLIALAVSRSVWLDGLIMFALLPTAALGFSMLAPDMLLARWFQAHRARAMSLAMLGWPIGTVIIPPVVGVLIRNYGWRASLGGIGLGLTIILMSLNIFIRDRPGPSDIEPARAAPLRSEAGHAELRDKMGLRSLLGSIPFVGNVFGFALVSACMQACQVTLVPLALHAGHSTVSATSLVSLNGAGALVSILTASIIADRFERGRVLIVLSAIVTMMTGAFLFSGQFVVLAFAAFALGAGNALPPVLYTLLADRFGRASFGTMLGLVTPTLTACCAAAYLFAGASYDASGSYDIMLYVFGCIQLSAIILIYLVNFGLRRSGGRPRPLAS